MNRKIDFDKELDFKKLCPELYKETQTWFVDEFMKEYITCSHENLCEAAEVIATEERKFVSFIKQEEGADIGVKEFSPHKWIIDKLSDTSDHLNDYLENAVYFYNGNWTNFFEGFEKDKDFNNLLRQYCEYQECDYESILMEDGTVSYWKASSETATAIQDDILRPFIKQLLEDEKTIESVNNLINEHMAEELAAYVYCESGLPVHHIKGEDCEYEVVQYEDGVFTFQNGEFVSLALHDSMQKAEEAMEVLLEKFGVPQHDEER